MISSKVFRHLLRASYVLPLARFVTAAEENHHDFSADGVVDPVAWPDVDSEFADTAPNRLVVTEVPLLNALDANADPNVSAFVAQSRQPLCERVAPYNLIFHSRNVSNWKHLVKPACCRALSSGHMN